MTFDRSKYKKDISIRETKNPSLPPTKKGVYNEKVSYKVHHKNLEESELSRIRVKDIKEDIHKYFVDGLALGERLGLRMDEFITWRTGMLAIVTGIPSHGKSEFVDFLISSFATQFGWKTILYSPENFPVEIHFGKIAQKILGQRPNIEFPEFEPLTNYIDQNFSWIYYDEKNTIDILIQTADKYVREDGIKVFVIDPYNMIDVSMLSNESETLYINRLLGYLEKFAKKKDVLVILVAHPTKMRKDKDNKTMVPDLYDVSGSAHFYNKADYGISIHRQKDENGQFLDQSEIHIQKVRFNYLGRPGMVEMVFNKRNGRFSDFKMGEQVEWDNSNWMDTLDIPDVIEEKGEEENA